LSHIKAGWLALVLSNATGRGKSPPVQAKAMKTQNNLPIPNAIVIVVDDDRAVRNSLKFSLEIEGFSVRTYACGGDLLSASTPLTCACLVVDQNMPGMTGLELIARLRDRHISAPAILITTHPSAALAARAACANIRIVEKPLLGNTLVDRIHDACAQHNNSQS
jgi:FixJ family two-component response regulator